MEYAIPKCKMMGKERGTYGRQERCMQVLFLWGQLRKRRPLGRPRRTCEDNIRMDLQEVGWGHWLD
jgi:hypothetical protein